MKITTAINKLEKNGFTVTDNLGTFLATNGVIEIMFNTLNGKTNGSFHSSWIKNGNTTSFKSLSSAIG